MNDTILPFSIEHLKTLTIQSEFERFIAGTAPDMPTDCLAYAALRKAFFAGFGIAAVAMRHATEKLAQPDGIEYVTRIETELDAFAQSQMLPAATGESAHQE